MDSEEQYPNLKRRIEEGRVMSRLFSAEVLLSCLDISFEADEEREAENSDTENFHHDSELLKEILFQQFSTYLFSITDRRDGCSILTLEIATLTGTIDTI